MTFWSRKSYVHDLPFPGHPVTAVSPVTLQCADAIICENQHVRTWQWHSLYQSAKEMLEIFDNWRCAQEKLTEKPSYLGYLQQMKPGPLFWARDKKAIHGMAQSSVSMEEENLKILSEQARSWSLSVYTAGWFLQTWCREGRKLLCMHQDADKTQEDEFCLSIHQKSCFSTTMHVTDILW